MKTLDCNNHAKSFTREGAVDPEEYEEKISDDAVDVKEGNYTFLYTYPLSVTAKFEHQLTPATSWIDILLLAKADYERIYKEEEGDVGNPGHIPGMLNRASSDGPYGIWGHDFSDLFFERVEVNEEDLTVNFGMGS